MIIPSYKVETCTDVLAQISWPLPFVARLSTLISPWVLGLPTKTKVSGNTPTLLCVTCLLLLRLVLTAP